jgi:putative NADPH-quinone reductase
MKLLYINACVRRESRTNRIAKALISKITGAYAGAAGAASGAAGTVTDSTGADADSFIVEERTLDTLGLQPLNEERLNRRTELIEAQAWNAPVFDLAKQFAAADIIVISAPYWDGSFPALLKLYLENIYVTGIVSRYGGKRAALRHVQGTETVLRDNGRRPLQSGLQLCLSAGSGAALFWHSGDPADQSRDAGCRWLRRGGYCGANDPGGAGYLNAFWHFQENKKTAGELKSPAVFTAIELFANV